MRSDRGVGIAGAVVLVLACSGSRLLAQDVVVEWPADAPTGVLVPVLAEIQGDLPAAARAFVGRADPELPPARFQRSALEPGRVFALLPARPEERSRYRLVPDDGATKEAWSIAGATAEATAAGATIDLTGPGGRRIVYAFGPRSSGNSANPLTRSCYVRSVLDPAGVDVLDDFPADHPHHRGISWMWPVVRIGEQRVDLWHLKGIAPRSERVVVASAGSEAAELRLQNGWFAGERRVVAETVSLRACAARDVAGRDLGTILDVELTWEALEMPVTLGGQPSGAKGYGGFGARLAPAKDVAIVTARARLEEDSLHQPAEWADFSARFRGADAVSGLAILPHPANAGFPNPWILRFYGFAGECWPHHEAFTLAPGAPVRARHRVYVHRGDAAAGLVAQLRP